VYEDGAFESSYVELDHRALSFERNGDRVAFPLTVYGNEGVDSSLEVFSVNAEQGIERLGAVRPPETALDLNECLLLMGYGQEDIEGWLSEELEANPELSSYFLRDCSYYRESMRRGLFRDDVTYAVSTQGIYAHRDLAAPAVGQVDLPPAQYYGPYYGGFGVMVDGAGGGSAFGEGGSSMASAGASMMTGEGGAGPDEE
jgi:hypothetical protein